MVLTPKHGTQLLTGAYGVNAIYQSHEKASFANRFALSFSYDYCMAENFFKKIKKAVDKSGDI